MGLSAFSSQASFSVRKSYQRVPRRIVSVMTPQQSERKPATTGSVGFCFMILANGFDNLVDFNGGFVLHLVLPFLFL